MTHNADQPPTTIKAALSRIYANTANTIILVSGLTTAQLHIARTEAAIAAVSGMPQQRINAIKNGLRYRSRSLHYRIIRGALHPDTQQADNAV